MATLSPVNSSDSTFFLTLLCRFSILFGSRRRHPHFRFSTSCSLHQKAHPLYIIDSKFRAGLDLPSPMATDFTKELSKNTLPGPKQTLPLAFGIAAAGNGHVDQHQNRRSCGTKEGIESQSSAVGRIPESHASVFDIFKKIRRAERFGIPVRLSEAEKRFSRAERFGIDSVCGPDEMAKAEELKRKARAERFELLTLSVATDEEAKKKARLARFAPCL